MDNILKLLLGVLAISGLIALLLPSQKASVAPANPAAAPVVARAVPLPKTVAGNESDTEDEEVELPDEAEEDEFKFGEPSIDGQPFGGSFDPPPNNRNPNPNPESIDSPEPTAPLPTNGEGVVLQ